MNFLNFWQNLPAKMVPAIQIGPISLQFYSLMYIVAFVLVYQLLMFRIKKDEIPYSKSQIADLLNVGILGTIFGARLGYVLFYNLEFYLKNPLQIISPFDLETRAFTGSSGMSYHGGLIGVALAILFFSKRNKISFLELGDAVGPTVPIAYMFGRLGNFINGELYGRVTTSPIGMHFSSAQGEALRHPSQLYEGFFEGVILFAIMWPLRNKFPDKKGVLSGIYLFGYGFFRFCIEFFREPDDHIGFIFLNLSMGQLLCFAMMSAGIAFGVIAHKRQTNTPSV